MPRKSSGSYRKKRAPSVQFRNVAEAEAYVDCRKTGKAKSDCYPPSKLTKLKRSQSSISRSPTLNLRLQAYSQLASKLGIGIPPPPLIKKATTKTEKMIMLNYGRNVRKMYSLVNKKLAEAGQKVQVMNGQPIIVDKAQKKSIPISMASSSIPVAPSLNNFNVPGNSFQAKIAAAARKRASSGKVNLQKLEEQLEKEKQAALQRAATEVVDYDDVDEDDFHSADEGTGQEKGWFGKAWDYMTRVPEGYEVNDVLRI